jgi:Uma2 family endonuclease
MSETALVTAEELLRLPRGEWRYELVEGRLIRMSPVGYPHARTVMRFGSLLERHVRERRLGEIFTELGFTLAFNPDTVRAPDVAFIRRNRIPTPPPGGFWIGPPDLAVEVLSPDDRPRDIAAKTAEYLERGVRLVLVVDPESQLLTMHASGEPSVHLHRTDRLDLDRVVPGFSCAIGDLFD